MSNSTSTQAVSAGKSNFGAKGWMILIFSFLCIMFQSSLINDSLNVVVYAFAEQNGWNPSILYTFSTIAAWIAVAGAAFWGFVSQKLSLRFTWAVSLGITVVSAFFWGRSSTLGLYFLCLAVSTVGGQAFGYIANHNVISNWFPRKKGLAMGWVTIGFPLSASVTVPLVSGLMAKGGLQAVYTFYGAAALVLCVVGALLIRDYPEQAGCFPDNDHTLSSEDAQKHLAEGMEYMKHSPWTVKKLLATKQTWVITFSLGIMQLLSLGIMTNFMPRCLQAGYQQPQIVTMLMVAGLIACFGSYACGQLDARLGTKKAIIVTLIVAVVAIVLNLIPTTITMYLSLPFLGFMLGGAANYVVSLTNTIWGRYDFPLAYKVINPLVACVGAAGVALVGVLGNTFSYAVAYGVLAVLAVLATIVIATIDDSLIGRDI